MQLDTLVLGFGLMDWNRLKQSSKDLPQLRGTGLKNYTLEEVRNHKSLHDCWIVLRGVVYNVSAYLAYHPGGSRIIEKFAGEECTEEFDKYHQWVNIEGLVGVLKVGFIAKK
ncbi:hypothetical protein TL16_g07265 [Triparma laevis f. inornata]|uniref:Cytochrome b5 heme-binding domain-containing protein n=2 Tax=Triparma laevis TaxID=1534972 RepID=A0A9W7CLD9_9STRA|nr:hypothetical protein TL16_g07265 [Triparma laevis f. inornata]GMI06706.1 hypothetical protein TrLO_g618 [Triparma laevis f. longispina]